jgi:nucleoside-diphosphate-sugar epimerase
VPGKSYTGKSYLVTGGSGFIGASLTRRLIADGHAVRVLDDNSRGALRRLDGVAGDYEFIQGDVRDADTVARACKGVDGVLHLAYVNGTEFFYSKPELVLEVGVKGMVNVLDGCLAAGVGELVLASSSEVYQVPSVVPTPEDVAMVVPDPMNPRYSYGGGKIISELMALNYGRRFFERVQIFRPHNVYGPDMSWEHVLPQFALRMKKLAAGRPDGRIPFPIQGDGGETRAFVHIDDFVEGVAVMMRAGEHMQIYNVGTDEERTVADVAHLVAAAFGREIELVPGARQPGSTPRRCPDISKLKALGYVPRVPLAAGLPGLVAWYAANAPMEKVT